MRTITWRKPWLSTFGERMRSFRAWLAHHLPATPCWRVRAPSRTGPCVDNVEVSWSHSRHGCTRRCVHARARRTLLSSRPNRKRSRRKHLRPCVVGVDEGRLVLFPPHRPKTRADTVNGSACVILCRCEQATQVMWANEELTDKGCAAGFSVVVFMGVNVVAVAANAGSDDCCVDTPFSVRNSLRKLRARKKSSPFVVMHRTETLPPLMVPSLASLLMRRPR